MCPHLHTEWVNHPLQNHPLKTALSQNNRELFKEPRAPAINIYFSSNFDLDILTFTKESFFFKKEVHIATGHPFVNGIQV